MKVKSALLAALLASVSFASETQTLLKARRAYSSVIVPGYWNSNLSAAKTYAKANNLPLIAVYSNGDRCSHCIRFESSCNSSYFKSWMKSSGCVFVFSYYGDSYASSVLNWCFKSQTTYPCIRIWWPAGSVDSYVMGDNLIGSSKATDGGKKAVAYLKKKLAKFDGKGAPAAVKPYTIEFEPNGGTGTMAAVKTKVGATLTLPANAFKRADCTFSGWAKSASGSPVVYKNKASVKNLTTVSNGVATLYAKWTRTTYRTYYVGLSSTVAMTSLKGWTTSSSVPGLKWSSKTGKWTGKPTKAGTYTVKFKKGSSSATRKIVVAKDVISFGDESAVSMAYVSNERIEVDLAPYSQAGAFTVTSVTGLPDGLSYSGGAISGSTSMVGTFKVTVTGVSAASQKLSRTFDFRIGVPDDCVGVFYGFIGFANTNRVDELAFYDRGTFRLSAPSNAALSAKVVTAKATYTFTATGWRDNSDGTYTAILLSASGKDSLSVTVGANTPPYESICDVGSFVPSYGTVYEVWAQRSPFVTGSDGEYLNPLAAEMSGKVVGTWYFKTYQVGSQWVLLYGTSKSYALKLAIKADGSATLAGTIGSYNVSASSSVFLFENDIDSGFVRADFPIPVTVTSGKTKVKKTLDVFTNLWFDRSNDHFNVRGEWIGGASLETFE